MLTNHENLQTFIIIKKLSKKQVQWIKKMSVYNVHIIYQLKIKNSANRSSWKSNYVVTVKFENANKKELNFNFVKLREQLQLYFMKSV